MGKYYKLSEAEERTEGRYTVEDFLRAGANGDVELFYYCNVPIERIEMLMDVNQITGEPHWDEIYNSKTDDQYLPRINKGYFKLSIDGLKGVFYNIKQFVVVSSRYDKVNEEMIVYDRSLKIGRKAVLITAQDLKDFVPSGQIKISKGVTDRTHPFYAEELAIALKVWTELFADKQKGWKPKQSFKVLMESKLKEHGITSMNASNQQKRIMTLINPDCNPHKKKNK